MMLRGLPALFSFVAVAHVATSQATVGIDETNGHQGIGFDPSAIVPAAGDTVIFTYQLPSYIKDPQSAQHSATQSTFDDPCMSMPEGFDTGVRSVGSENNNTGNSYSLLVNDTQPSWFFSSVGSDCKSGMVLAVNAPITDNQTAAAFKAKALASSSSSANPTKPSSGGPTQTANTAASQSSSTQTAAPSATSPPPARDSQVPSAAASHMVKMEMGLAAMVAIVGVDHSMK